MGIRKLCTDGSWAVNGIPIYIPDPDVEFKLEDMYAKGSGRTESGHMHKTLVRSGVRTVTLPYGYITGDEKDYLTSLFCGQGDFIFTYYDNGVKTISSSYSGAEISWKGYSRSLHRSEGGLYKGLTIDVIEN